MTGRAIDSRAANIFRPRFPRSGPVVQFIADPFDEIVVSNDEVSGLTPTVDGYINVEPA